MDLDVSFTLELVGFSADEVSSFHRYLRDSKFRRVDGVSDSWRGAFLGVDSVRDVYSFVISHLYDAWGFAKLVSGGVMPGSSVNYDISLSSFGVKSGTL